MEKDITDVIDYLTYRSFLAQRELYGISLEGCVKLFGEQAIRFEKIRISGDN